MKNSLFLKILKSYILIIFFFIIITLPISYKITKNFYIQILTKNLKDINYILSFQIKNLLDSKDNYLLNEFFLITKQNLNLRITLIRQDGTVIADSDSDPKTMDNHLSRPEVAQALKNNTGVVIRYSSTLKEDMLYVATKIKKSNEFLILRTSYSLKDVERFLHILRNKIITILILFLIFILFLAFIVSYSITKPIKELTKTTQTVANGNFDIKYNFYSKDEVGILTKNFNFMLEKIKNLIQEISHQRDKIQNIFSSIQEAVVLLDKQGKILMYNDKFSKLCRTSPQGKYYWEVLLSSEFNEFIREGIKENKNFIKETSIGEKIFILSLSFISKEEFVVLLYDITEHKNLQNVKKELISNIVHELKTPLTIIRGFAETLSNEIKNSNHKNYLEKILFNTDRLIKIVNDLTTLSLLEQKNIKLEIEDVNLVEVVNFIKTLFIEKIKQKNLEFIVNLQKDIHTIKADKFRLEQLFINLVDNAIRYTDKGFIKINISQDEKTTQIEVEDTGIGIPKEHHQRIFERFFVVDKARSRQTGGTGLGLAIVKHIVELHKGTLFLESQVGVGTKFKIVLNNEI